MKKKKNTKKLYLAPLRGYTGFIFRNTYSKHFSGFDLAVSPFISTVQGKRIKIKLLKDVLPENNNRLPVIPQILGNDSDQFVVLAERLYELGYHTINWNLGCPFPKVIKKLRGAGLLPFYETVDSFLDKTLSKMSCRLSIKLRLGKDSDEDIFNLIPILNQYPLDEIIIHPRTAKQMYNGETDLRAFEKCLPLIKHPVAYNGDITSPDRFYQLAERFHQVEGWMLGRGAIADPFLPGIIKEEHFSEIEKIEKFSAFHDELLDEFQKIYSGSSHVFDKMKGYWCYFARSFKTGEKVLKKIKKINTIERYKTVVSHFFQEEAEWIDD